MDDEWLEKNAEIKKVKEKTGTYLNYAEQNIEMDEYCYLITAVFGGMKQIRNDKRIINNLMVIASKVFEHEVDESSRSHNKLGYTFDDILHNRMESAFSKLHRQIFHCQYQNVSFVDELFEQIVHKLFRERSRYRDGLELHNTKNNYSRVGNADQKGKYE